MATRKRKPPKRKSHRTVFWLPEKTIEKIEELRVRLTKQLGAPVSRSFVISYVLRGEK